MPTVAEQKQTLIDGGYPPDDANAWATGQLKTLEAAGFSQDEIAKQAGIQLPEKPAGVQDQINKNIAAENAERARLAAEDAATAKEKAAKAPTPADAVTGQVEVVGKPPTPSESLWDAFMIGLHGSGIGMTLSGQMPKQLPADSDDRAHRLAVMTGQYLGDLPLMYAGGYAGATVGGAATVETGPGAVGGAAVGGLAGAFALPSAYRAAIAESIRRGKPVDAKDFALGLVASTWEALKAGAKGALVGATAAAGGAVVSNAAKAVGAGEGLALTGDLSTQFGVAIAASSFLEGNIPSSQDFADNAYLMAATVLGARMVQGSLPHRSATAAMAETYAATGIKPDAMVVLAEHDPTIAGDILAERVPFAFKDQIDPEYKALLKDKLPSDKAEPNLEHLNDIHPDAQGPALNASDAVNRAQEEVDALRAELNAQADHGQLNPATVKALARAQATAKEWEDTYHKVIDESSLELTPVEAVGAKSMAAKYPIKTGEITITPSIKGSSQLGNDNAMRSPNVSAVATDVEGNVIGHVYLENMGDGVLKPIHIGVEQPRQGIGTALYQYFADRGFRIDMGNTQTPDGKALRSAIGIVGEANATKAQEFINGVRNDEYAASAESAAPPPAPPHDPIKAITDKIDFMGSDPKQPWSWNSIYTKIFDNAYPIKVAQKAMGLETAPISERPYDLFRLTRGDTGRAEQQLRYGTYDWETYQNNGESLADIFGGKANERDTRNLAAYLYARRAVEKIDQGIDVGVSKADAETVLALGKTEYEGLAERITEYSNRVTYSNLVQTGILSKEAWEKDIKPMNKNYVPLNRVMDGDEGGLGFGGGGPRDPIKKMEGSDRQVINPIESIVKNTFVYTHLGELNAAVGAFVKGAEESGMPEQFMKKVPAKIVGTKASEAEMKKMFADAGVDNPPESVMTLFRAVRQPLKDNQIGFFRDGKYEVYEVDKDVATAFRNLDYRESGLIVKALTPFASALRAGATITPEFIGANLGRDALSSFIQQPFGKSVPGADQFLGALAVATKNADMQNFLKGGGSNSMLVSQDRDYIRREFENLNLKTLDEQTGVMSRGWNIIKTPWDYLRALSETMESATRVGNARRAPETAGAPKTKDEILEMGWAGRTGSMDFQRRGSDPSVQALNKIVPFFNMGLQGADVMVRQWIPTADRPAMPLGTAAKVLVGIVLPSVILYEMNKDDPRYEDITHGDHNTKFIYMTPDTIYRIPKPFNEGVAYGGGTEQLLKAYDAWRKGQPQNTKDQAHFAQDMAANLGVGVIPQAALPILEQATNYNFFSGNPVVPSGKEKFLPEYQYNDYTTETSKAIGRLVGQFPGMNPKSDFMPKGLADLQAPMILDNYIREWSGGAGNYVMQLADAVLRKTGVVPDPVRPDKTLADIPFVKAFVVRYPSAQAQHIQDFYETEAAHKQFADTFQMLGQIGDTAGISRLLKTNLESADAATPALSANLAKLKGVKDTLDRLTRVVHVVNIDPDMNGSDKRQLIDQLYSQAILSAHVGNDLFKQIDASLEQLPRQVAK